MSITPAARKIVDATAPVLAANINKVVGTFYPRMFRNNPEVLKYFNPANQATGRQPQALSNAVIASVGHLDNLAAIDSAFNLMAHKHCALGVQAADYKIVHDNFLGAVAEVLGDAVTPEVGSAWSEVLMLLAGELINREKALYEKAAQRVGGWSGVKEFEIAKIKQETSDVKSFWLKTKDGSPPPEFTPGQYVTVCNAPNGQHPVAPRHYTVSHNAMLRISSRWAAHDTPAPLMSGHLHGLAVGDVVSLRPPFGEFDRSKVKGKSSDTVEVYLTGGIGITTCCAMAGEAAKDGRRVVVFHSSTNDEHPLLDEIDVDTNKGFKVTGHRQIIADATKTLKENNIDLQNCHFFVCGPVGLMELALHSLKSAGIDDANIDFEAFGPRPSLS